MSGFGNKQTVITYLHGIINGCIYQRGEHK